MREKQNHLLKTPQELKNHISLGITQTHLGVFFLLFCSSNAFLGTVSKGLCSVQSFSLDHFFFPIVWLQFSAPHLCDMSFMLSNTHKKLNWMKLNLPNAMSHFYNNVFRSSATGHGNAELHLCRNAVFGPQSGAFNSVTILH